MKKYEVTYINTLNNNSETFHSYEKISHAIQIAKTIAFSMNTCSFVTDNETGEILFDSEE